MKYKWSFFIAFLLYALRIFFDSVLKTIYFKKIIDVISTPSVVKGLVAPELTHLVVATFFILLGGYICSRFGAWCMVYFQSNIMRELANYSFGNIINNSYNFFSNRFVGSLVTKSRRFVRAFEVMHDTFVFNFWSTFITLFGIFIVLFIQAPLIALVFFVWVFVYLFIISFFIKTNMRYDIEPS